MASEQRARVRVRDFAMYRESCCVACKFHANESRGSKLCFVNGRVRLLQVEIDAGVDIGDVRMMHIYREEAAAGDSRSEPREPLQTQVIKSGTFFKTSAPDFIPHGT